MVKNRNAVRSTVARRLVAFGMACAAGVAVSISRASAGDIVWQGGEGNWNAPNKWDLGKPPTDADDVNIGRDSPLVHVGLVRGQAKNITLNGTIDDLRAGLAVVKSLVVGNFGAGHVMQADGSADVMAETLILGQSRGDAANVPSSSGEYVMAGGRLFVTQSTEVGSWGSGLFTQGAGLCQPGDLTLGTHRGVVDGTEYAGWGAYELVRTGAGDAAELRPHSLAVGNEGEGFFTQSGNTLVDIGLLGTGSLVLGAGPGGVGYYSLDADATEGCGLRAGFEGIGAFGTGDSSHASGRNEVRGLLSIGGPARGTYGMGGGELIAGRISVNVGDFSQDGGVTTVSDTMGISTTGSLHLSGGELGAPSLVLLGLADQTGGVADFDSVLIDPETAYLLHGGLLTCGWIGGGRVLELGGRLVLKPVFVWSGAAADVAADATLELSGPGTFDAAPVSNSGHIAVSVAGAIDATGGTAITNSASGVLDLQADASIASSDATAIINNGGYVTKSGGSGTSAISVPLNNSGTVSVGSGTLWLSGGGTHTGTFTAYNGSTLAFTGGAQYSSGTVQTYAGGTVSFSGGTHTFNTGSTLTANGMIEFTGGSSTLNGAVALGGVGTIRVAGADVTVNGAVSCGNQRPTLALESGSLTGPGSIAMGMGTFEWTGGTMGTSLSVSRQEFVGAINISGSGEKTLEGTLTNEGPGATINWSGGNIIANDGAHIVTPVSNIVNITCDASILAGTGSASVENYGNFDKTAGSSGTSTIAIPVNLHGDYAAIHVNSGTLSFTGGCSIEGAVSKGGSGVLEISGEQSHSAGATLAVSAGTLNMNSNAGGSTGSSPNLSISVASGAVANFGSTQNLAGLSIGAGGVAKLGDGQWAMKTGSLSIAGSTNAWTGKLDLDDGFAVIQSLPDGSDHAVVVARVTNQVKSGFNGGDWAGNGITSSVAANDPNGVRAVGMIDNGEAGYTSFGGHSADGNSVLARQTYYGDSDLNGGVDIQTDLDLWLTGFNGGGSGWLYGDYNYDGVIDSQTDLDLWLSGFSGQGEQGGNQMRLGEDPTMDVLRYLDELLLQRWPDLPGRLASLHEDILAREQALANGYGRAMLAMAPVPEPAGFSLLAVGAVGMLRRRRRRG